VSFSRAQFGTQPYHFGRISGIFWKRWDDRKPFSDAGLESAGDGNRTHTPLAGPRILSSKPAPALSGVIGRYRFQSAIYPQSAFSVSPVVSDTRSIVWTKFGQSKTEPSEAEICPGHRNVDSVRHPISLKTQVSAIHFVHTLSNMEWDIHSQ